MYHQFSLMLAVLLLVIAGVTVLVVLDMNSTPEKPRSSSPCLLVQQVFGYFFLALFAALLACIIFQAGSLQEDMPAPATMLVLLLAPLVMIKVVVARQKAHVSTKLMLLGIAIFGLSFGLTGMAAKYYTRHSSMLKSGLPVSTGMEPGQAIMNKKCSKCHSLERVYTTSAMDWSPIVSRMANFDAPNISSNDAKHIVSYLNQLEEKKRQEQLEEKIRRGRKLISAKCSFCHSLDKVFIADMSAQLWRETIERMIKISGDPNYMNEEEKELAVNFLSSRRQGRRELWTAAAENDAPSDQFDGVRKLMARKCSAGCHTLERVLRSKEKNRAEGTELVNSMIEMTGDPEYLSEPEKQQIIDFLSLPPAKRGNGAAAPPSAKLDHPLLKKKCERCHSLQLIGQTEKNVDEWTQTVSKMADNTGDPNYLTEQEKKDIITIISGWEVVK